MQVLMQAVDPIILGCDLVFADAGQRKIYWSVEGAQGERQITYVFSPLSLDIRGRPLNESSRGTRISFHDDEPTIRDKVSRMVARPTDTRELRDPLLEHLRWSVFPWLTGTELPVRSAEGWRTYARMLELQVDYESGVLCSEQLREALADALVSRLRRIQANMPIGILDWYSSDATSGIGIRR